MIITFGKHEYSFVHEFPCLGEPVRNPATRAIVKVHNGIMLEDYYGLVWQFQAENLESVNGWTLVSK